MQRELAEKIFELAEYTDYPDENFALTHDYSGRGMYGNKTSAIIGLSLGNALSIVVASANEFVDENGDPIFNNFPPFYQDSMGLSTVIY